jgi:vacuolar protein sorting-associated protein 35
LKVILGTNINNLSKLEGLDNQIYKNEVLPKLINIIIESKDYLTQQFVLESIIAAFSDEFHLETLDILLNSFIEVEEGVSFTVIYTSLLDRLSYYIQNNNSKVSSIISEINLLEKINKYIKGILIN